MKRTRQGLGIAAILGMAHLASSCGAPRTAQAPGPRLEISLPDSGVSTLSADQLRKHRSATSLSISSSPAYEGMALSFRVVPMSDLLPARYARPDMSVVFECLDGFAATIPATRALGRATNGPRAFLAIEDPASPWPALQKHPGETAGPFYLIWEGKHPAQTIPEEWPYQIQRIVVRPAEEAFREIVPDRAGASDAPVMEGFQVFVRNCSPCHTLNGVGKARMGPDLNTPMSPIEYFKEGVFEKYVRDPASVRQWPDRRMPSFPTDILSDAELNELHAYLAYMAGRKQGVPSTEK